MVEKGDYPFLCLYFYETLLNPFPNDKHLDSSKLKEFADDNLKFDKIGRKLSKRVENMWEKEKLLVTSNFSFSHTVFKDMYGRHVKTRACLGEG